MRTAKFIKSATQKGQYPRSRLPRIAFLGRSNVGKSSLLNCLIGQKRLARTSSTPGRTQVINFYAVEDRYLFVDLPGYGYARVPAKTRKQWGPMIEEFLKEDEQLKLAILIVDARHKPSELDRMMAEWLRRYQIPFQVAATKVDKLSRNQMTSSIESVEKELEINHAIAFSATRSTGRRQIWTRIETAIEL